MHEVFKLLPACESVQEIAEDLAPKIKNLESLLKSVKEYHPIEFLYNTVLMPDLNSNIIRSLPAELRLSLNYEYAAFIKLNADKIQSPAVFPQPVCGGYIQCGVEISDITEVSG